MFPFFCLIWDILGIWQFIYIPFWVRSETHRFQHHFSIDYPTIPDSFHRVAPIPISTLPHVSRLQRGNHNKRAQWTVVSGPGLFRANAFQGSSHLTKRQCERSIWFPYPWFCLHHHWVDSTLQISIYILTRHICAHLFALSVVLNHMVANSERMFWKPSWN